MVAKTTIVIKNKVKVRRKSKFGVLKGLKKKFNREEINRFN